MESNSPLAVCVVTSDPSELTGHTFRPRPVVAPQDGAGLPAARGLTSRHAAVNMLAPPPPPFSPLSLFQRIDFVEETASEGQV